MSRGTHLLILFMLLALGGSLTSGTAEAAHRSAPPKVTAPCSGNWLAQVLGHLPFGAGKRCFPLDSDGKGCPKNGLQLDPNGQPGPNKSGLQIDPDGSGTPRP